MRTSVDEDRLHGFRRVWLRSDALEVAVLPELGGKLISLQLRTRTHNVLLEPPDFGYRRASYGASFEEFDTSGFDECFPTVAACEVDGERLPDHGALWSTEWSLERDGESLLMHPNLPTTFPWTFTRRLTVRGPVLRLDYEVASRVNREVPALWSAHPLLSVSPGSRIFLPEEVRSVRVESSSGDRLGRHGDVVGWPEHGGRRLDVLEGPHARTADKLFTPALHSGVCAFHDARSDVSVTYRFDVAQTPYVGLWITQGGWPVSESRPNKHFTVALEPCSSPVDSLGEAVATGTAWTLAPGSRKRWILELEVRAGPPRFERGRQTREP